MTEVFSKDMEEQSIQKAQYFTVLRTRPLGHLFEQREVGSHTIRFRKVVRRQQTLDN